MSTVDLTRACIAAVGITACATAFAEGTRLMGDELKSFIPGKSFTGATQRGGTWEATYNPDGTYKVWVHNSDWSDEGTWEIKDDQMCTERSKKAYSCADFYRVTDTNYHWLDSRGQTSKATLKN